MNKMSFAGSAIAQNAGQRRHLEALNNGSVRPMWLLLCGATDPPDEVSITKRRPRDSQKENNGAFLRGVSKDLLNMEDMVGFNLHNAVRDLYMTKSSAVDHIKRLFEDCKKKGRKPMLYYTGNGQVGTGNWCFDDGTISVKEIHDMIPGGCYYPMIFSDCCYSGHWSNFCLKMNISGFECLAACPDFTTAADIPDKGGELTLYMTGNAESLPNGRPSTEPMYSGGSIGDYPITSGYRTIDYTDFISSHMINSNKILISQNLSRNSLSVIIASHRKYDPRPSLVWGFQNSYQNLVNFVKEQWPVKQIVNIVADDNAGFGVYLMANYGAGQTILPCNADNINEQIKKGWDDGKQITACTAQGSWFYVIMTKNVEEYQGKQQTWFTLNSRSAVEEKVQEKWSQGFIVTVICYCSGLKQYLVVMTKSEYRQMYFWTSNHDELNKWIGDNFSDGFFPTLIFNDTTDDQTLVVSTQDENRFDYTCRYNYEIK